MMTGGALLNSLLAAGEVKLPSEKGHLAVFGEIGTTKTLRGKGHYASRRGTKQGEIARVQSGPTSGVI